ncbi:MAG: restriction endonuclease subunit S [Ilumatobacter sp.]|uniref:restriction endonuclease subunit S n=1 Tax=Ilumatobacter sp. TaxID=1967498 RepID=UPI00391BFF7F
MTTRRAALDPGVPPSDPEFQHPAKGAAERFRLSAQGSTRQMINLEIFKSLRIPLPPVDRQQQIVDEVHAAWRTLDAASAALSSQIDLLVEHRQALITAAVTGEFAVPGAA